MNTAVPVPNTLRIFLGVVLTVAVLRYAEDVFVPIALALLLTFLLAPLVDFLQKLSANRALAVFVAVTIGIALLGTLIFVILYQFTDVLTQLPRYRRQLRSNLTELTGFVMGGMSGTTEAMEQLAREINRSAPGSPPAIATQAVHIVKAPPTLIESFGNLIAPLVKPAANAAVVIVFTIFMLLRLPDLRDRVIRLLGARNLRTTIGALNDAAQRVSRYLLMQTLINTWQGFWLSAGLWFLGVPNALLWGALTIVLRFIPYIGPWVAAAMPVALSFAVFDSWQKPLMVGGLFVVLELISNMILEPWLYGKRTGISPLGLLVAATFWTWLWGIVGLFLAIPLTVCLMVMGKHMRHLEFLYVLLGDEAALEPHEQLYQRLLAGKPDEANEVLIHALRSNSPRKVADEILVRAMKMAEEDHAAGTLNDSQRRHVISLIGEWAPKLAEARAPMGALRRVSECHGRVSNWKLTE